MVKIVKGDLLASKAQTLVNPVNCVGVMGKGLALIFKEKYPNMFYDYKKRCYNGEVVLGKPYLYKNEAVHWILNFPTKYHWKDKSNIQDIIACLQYLLENYQEWGITSLAVPALGCGHGGLEWSLVKPILCDYLSLLTIDVEIYQPL
jgi:O-acetyl-ADP-ribose deacetylase (regulator of RNase III)